MNKSVMIAMVIKENYTRFIFPLIIKQFHAELRKCCRNTITVEVKVLQYSPDSIKKFSSEVKLAKKGIVLLKVVIHLLLMRYLFQKLVVLYK